LDNAYSILNKIKIFEEFNELSSYVLKLILNPEYNLVQVKDIRLIRRLIDDSTKFSKENYNIKPLLILLDEVFNKINKFKNHFDEETFKSYVLMKIDFEILKKSYEKLDKKET
ncbi:hypothetical protein, partial [Clostridium perfringens]|uniref:hypothetical protein n=1 Tax=Clostridium perfringens TaxID=1502 RepID=UPI00224638EC